MIAERVDVERSEHNVARMMRQGSRAEYLRAKRAKEKVAMTKLEAIRQRHAAQFWLRATVATWMVLALLNLLRVVASL